MNKKKLIKSFLIKAVIVFFVWQVAYHGFIKPNETVDRYLTNLVISGSVTGLNLLGFDSFGKDYVIYIDNQSSVLVADACNGLELIALYLGFFICFPGRIKPKLLYGLVGTILIIFINLLREIALALNYHYFQATFDLNHKYTYTLIVYAFVFLLWKHWLNRYSVLAEKTQTIIS